MVTYGWGSRSGRRDIIWMKKNIIEFHLEKDGMKSSFDVQAEKSDFWKCGNRSVPRAVLEPE